MAKQPATVRWGVYMLRKKAERVGSVEATNEADALKDAVSKLEIPEKDRWRLSVRMETE